MNSLRFVTILTLVFTLTSASAQKAKTYKIWITLVNQKQEIYGTLYTVDENELIIIRENKTQLKYVPESIQMIKVRRKGKLGKGFWIGAVSGAAIGAVIGSVSFQETYIEDVGPVIGGLIGVPVGALIGAGINSGREKYIVNGDKDTYLSLLPRLQQYTPQNAFYP